MCDDIMIIDWPNKTTAREIVAAVAELDAAQDALPIQVLQALREVPEYRDARDATLRSVKGFTQISPGRWKKVFLSLLEVFMERAMKWELYVWSAQKACKQILEEGMVTMEQLTNPEI